MNIKTHAPGTHCASCGMCCKSLPGAHSPDDFGDDLYTKVERLLASGRYSIDWWEGDVEPGGELSRVMFLRPATKGLEGVIYDPSWGGECTFLGDDGCELKRDDMPVECRALRPKATADGDCPSELNKEKVCRMWRPYQSMLAGIAAKIEQGEAA